MELRIALSGFGNVGQGLAMILRQHGDDYRRRYDASILLTGVMDRGGAAVDRRGLDLARLLAAKKESGTVRAYSSNSSGMDVGTLLARSEADVLVEAASTNFESAEPGWTFVRESIDRGLDIVFASKGSLALYWRGLFNRARERGVTVLFSATIASPLPSLDLAEYSLVGTDILALEGILNGTSHQILTAMGQGFSYDEGVKQAQAMGIAETDPTLDVDGWDAAAKAAILANAIFGTELTVYDVRREGIRGVTQEEIQSAAASGESVKLIARVARTDGGVVAGVAPERRSRDDALGRLSGDAMGVVFTVEPLGTMAVTIEGSGHGGGITTAMTVLRDVLSLARDGGPNRRR
jgi:homoserine dehydrogenase